MNTLLFPSIHFSLHQGAIQSTLIGAACVAGGILPGIIKTALEAYTLPKGVYEGIWSLVSTILGQMKIYGIVAAVLGIGLFVLGTTLGKKSSVETVSE